jgi:hypothetical protein
MSGETDREPRPPADERRRVPREVAGLKPLAELPDLEIADGDFDVRGWIVCSADDHVLGTVRDLLADVHTLRVRHLVVELGPEGTPAGEGPLVIVPLADVDPNPDRDVLVILDLEAAHVGELPSYRREELDRDLEAGLLRRIGVQAVVDAERRGTREDRGEGPNEGQG